MQVALAGTGVRIADGPLNILPIPPYRAAKDGAALTTRQVNAFTSTQLNALETNDFAALGSLQLNAINASHAMVAGTVADVSATEQ